MPSKGGRGTTTTNPTVGPAVVAGPAVVRTREEWDTAGFTVAEIGRPLRRGIDVERLNDLAAREDGLLPEEAEELYGYRLRRVQSRLRQLARARTRGDEEGIRAALDDLDGRLAELHRLEEERQRAGLAIGYELELDQRQAAIDQLLELARRRPPGLVAGSDVAPAQPTGDVRLPAIAFHARPTDVPVYILAPRSLPSDALAANVEAVARQGAQLHIVHDSADIPHSSESPPLVLNWGAHESLPGDLVALNRPEAVRIASDQVESVRRLGELAPRTVLRPDDMHLLGSDRVVAKQRQGARGSGKAVISADAAWSERCRYDLFQELVPRHREYRLSLLNGRVVSAYLKRAPDGTPTDNLRPDWSFERAEVLPRAVVAAAREGARRIGLDYSGVDVIEDPSGRVYCIEANAAPGMSEQTLRSLYAHLQQTLRRRLERAS
ncbi:MAG: ATP-grasp domain-containing protein [Candidatus Dormibacteraceae bacterium]